MIFGIVVIAVGIGIVASSGGAHHHGHARVHISPPPTHAVHIAGHAWHSGPCSVYPKGHPVSHRPAHVKNHKAPKHAHNPRNGNKNDRPATRNGNGSRNNQNGSRNNQNQGRPPKR